MNQRLFSFIGGSTGPWRIQSIRTIAGDPVAGVPRLDIVSGAVPATLAGVSWVLRGIKSSDRYVTRAEKNELVARQAALGRPEATCAALIPIRKTSSWWALAQDERRQILEERSQHVATGLRYLPAIARGLHHCRDLGEIESFDFLTWFEFAPEHVAAFDELLAELRATEEWRYVDREVDLRLVRDPG